MAVHLTSSRVLHTSLQPNVASIGPCFLDPQATNSGHLTLKPASLTSVLKVRTSWFFRGFEEYLVWDGLGDGWGRDWWGEAEVHLTLAAIPPPRRDSVHSQSWFGCSSGYTTSLLLILMGCWAAGGSVDWVVALISCSCGIARIYLLVVWMHSRSKLLIY